MDSPSPKKILVIEDDELVRANILELLEAEEFDAIGADNGRRGVHLAQELIPDLIICDVMMPSFDGYQVIAALRQDTATATIPFIFLSAKADPADFRSGMRLGADDYLTKPCRAEELLEAVATRLEKQATLTGRYTTALRQAAERLNHLVHYDRLTNLPNVILLRERYNQLIAKIDDERQLKESEALKNGLHSTNIDALPTLIVFSLDPFKRLEDSLGHTLANFLIKAVAEKLSRLSQHPSIGSLIHTTARLQSDQFALILNSATPDESISVASAIRLAIAPPFLLSGHEIFVTASIGIVADPVGVDADRLLENANAAMSRARQLGGNQHQFYTPNLKVSNQRLSLESALHRALEREELQLYYQPQVDLKTGKTISVEALARWYNPERGFISPADFIPLAEEIGLINRLGEWVLQTACKQAKTWEKAGYSLEKVAVNLSARQFEQPNLIPKLVETLTQSGLDSSKLELELTESLVMRDIEKASIALQEIKSLGISLAMDDFGTGYSSLYYLQQFAFDSIKIDQCFIRNITENTANQAIVKAIIQIAQSLNLSVLAEGVETEAELAFLRSQNCNLIQGYFYSRPLPVQDLEKFLRLAV